MMKYLITTTVALIAGFVGGLLGARAPRSGDPGTKEVIRARSFEVVNEVGQVISYWGVDEGDNLVLTFGSRGPSKGGALHGRPPLDLKNRENQLTALGLQGNDMPMLKMSGADGKTRVRLLLSYDGKPTLSMEDETGPRVSLGIEQSDTPGPNDHDWTLVFGPERARIGMFAEKIKGQWYYRGGLLVNRDAMKYPNEQP